MADETEKNVEELLLQGLTRQQVFQRLQHSAPARKLLFFINNSALPGDRKKHQLLNLLLVLLFTFITAKKLLAIFSFGMMGITMLLSLVVPIVNIYVLREVLRFHRLGYQFLFVLSLLSLLQPENHYLLEALLLVVIGAVSAFLYLKMFPKEALVPPEEASP
ncbi:MAG: hypothetical protein OEV73_08065 [Desulfobulbaceae bacterium]|nr:hypothetical protein [Desulfobulbaceae bacterium]